jgi:hypothetical protein
VALNFYQERSFEVPTSLPYEQETFTNRLGGEDAAFFDDYDNNQYYKVDGYASAGIPEAAPKVKREGRFQQEEEDDDEAAFRELEDSKLMAAAYDEMGFDEADLDVADGETPWDWNESESTVVSTTAAAASSNVEANEQAIMDDLSRLDLDSNQEIPLEDRDAMALILDPELLNDVDNDDDVSDAPLPPLDASAQLSAVSLLAAGAASSSSSTGWAGLGSNAREGVGHVCWYEQVTAAGSRYAHKGAAGVGTSKQLCVVALWTRVGCVGPAASASNITCLLLSAVLEVALHLRYSTNSRYLPCSVVCSAAGPEHHGLYGSSYWVAGCRSSTASSKQVPTHWISADGQHSRRGGAAAGSSLCSSWWQ